MDWKSVLKADPTEWLLEEDNPSVRYLTLTEILERPETDQTVKYAKSRIMETGSVPAILEKQNKGGFWDDPEKFYTAKYRGSVWQLMILAELGADGDDSRVKKACEFILERSQDPESGGFSIKTGRKTEGGLPSMVIPCLTGNMVWSLIRLGYMDDPRVRKGIGWITEYVRFDDSDTSPPKGWKYEKMSACYGKHSCHMGVVKPLKALAEIPHDKRSKAVDNTIDEGVEFILKHHVHKRSHDLARESKAGWRKFGFPLMYQTDILEILLILTSLGIRDDRMRDAYQILLDDQGDDGKWTLRNSYNGKVQVNIEEKGKHSKWITLNSLRVLKGYHG
ncbi:MAG: nitrogen fixation protein NifH [Thermoplasmatota archaeon]